MSDDEIVSLGAFRAARNGSMTIAELLEKAQRGVEKREATQRQSGDKTCRKCGESCAMLHSMPGEMHRTVCAVCCGKANREDLRRTTRQSGAVRLRKPGIE